MTARGQLSSAVRLERFWGAEFEQKSLAHRVSLKANGFSLEPISLFGAEQKEVEKILTSKKPR